MVKSKWESVKAKLHLVEKWARDGINEEKIAKTLGISVTTFELYKKDYPEFLKALKKGRKHLSLNLRML